MKKSISRRSFLKAVGALSAAGALAACGGSSTSTAASTASSAAPAASAEASGSAAANIKLWTYPIGGWGKDETVQEIIASFNAKYPDIKVTVEYLDYTNATTRSTPPSRAAARPTSSWKAPSVWWPTGVPRASWLR